VCVCVCVCVCGIGNDIVVFQGGVTGGGAQKAVKAEEFDIDIEQEARGHRVNRQVILLLSTSSCFRFIVDYTHHSEKKAVTPHILCHGTFCTKYPPLARTKYNHYHAVWLLGHAHTEARLPPYDPYIKEHNITHKTRSTYHRLPYDDWATENLVKFWFVVLEICIADRRTNKQIRSSQ